jgi:hypothetical protein
MTTRFPSASRALACVALVLLTAAGCSPKTKKPVPFHLTAEQADDFAQQVGLSIALANGGWLNEFTQLGAIPKPTAASPTPDSTAHPVVAGTSRYDIQYHFLDQHFRTIYTLGPADTVSGMVADVSSLGTISHPDSATFAYATYFHNTSVELEGYDTGDTLEFNGSTDDTLQAEFKPLTTVGHRYYITDILGSYDSARFLYGQPYPSSGTFDVDLTCDIYSTGFTQLLDEIDGTGTLTFNGTSTVTLGIWSDLESSEPKFRYTLHLDTGVVTRQF